MPINFSPKVGQILTCNYGNYLKDEKGDVVSTAVDAHIPPEMIKCRLVVVLNGRLNGNACIVVPISTTKDTAKLKEGANKRGNSSRLTQSFHFFMFEPIFSPVNALNQPI